MKVEISGWQAFSGLLLLAAILSIGAYVMMGQADRAAEQMAEHRVHVALQKRAAEASLHRVTGLTSELEVIEARRKDQEHALAQTERAIQAHRKRPPPTDARQIVDGFVALGYGNRPRQR